MEDWKKECVQTEKAPAAVGPYSQAIAIGNLIFTSGQLPLIAETGEMPESVVEQTRASLNNIKAILDEAGSDMSQVIKTTVFMTELEFFSDMNEVYASFFAHGELPARSCFQVARLPKGAKVEIEVVARR
ncbi:MAG: RidA family protein [Peptoniphilaceae bacterium]|nr:RidA family protein [Peptoniphilaceae bacterium]MDY6085843.1 RidA family protein [Peptoniphilaceae bacterium]